MKSTLKDMAGQRFGRWTVLRREGAHKIAHWRCRCDCGREKLVNGGTLRRGLTQSCGCLAKELTSRRSASHGRSRTTEYRIWAGMKTRCLNPADKHYKDYGGRGIAICARWLGADGFANFHADMGLRPEGHSIDRKDGNGDYEPSNCRWATSKEQTRNYGRNVLIEHNGETKCVIEWCEFYGKPYRRTSQRLRRGWTFDRALFADARDRWGNPIEATLGVPIETLKREAEKEAA